MDIKIPGYTLQRILGKGGMATVYLARQDMLERRVALKVMSRSLAEDPSFGARFMREAKIVSQLVHPNIVTVHEVGQHRGSFFLSMEYIDGHDLRTVRKKLDLEGKIRVVEDIARALHYAGEKGYVHRDIKPENIMFRQSDGSAVLTDFGIAKAVKSDLTMTQTGTAIGTPHYMSPEQAKGKDVDHRSDLYSLGAVFYLLLVGQVPFDGDSAVSIGIKHLTEAIPQLPRQYEELQFIIDGLMAKSPEDRYQSGLNLLNDLRRIDLERIDVVDFESDTQVTIAADVPTDIGEAIITTERRRRRSDDSKRFTLEFEAVEPIIEKPPRSIFPSFFAALFVLLSVAVFVYFARPASLEGFIAKAELRAEKIYNDILTSTKEKLDRADETLGETISGIKSDYEEVAAATQDLAANIEHTNAPDAADSGAVAATDSGSNSASLDTEAVVVAQGSLREVSSSADDQFNDIQEVSSGQSTSRPVPDIELPPLGTLIEELAAIQNKGRENSGLLSAEVEAHRKLLSFYPDHKPTLLSLETLKNDNFQELLASAQQGNTELVSDRFNIFKAVFSEELNPLEIENKTKELERQLKIVELFARAENQIEQQQLSSPPDNNAIASLQAIIVLDPGNEIAANRLSVIADSFYKQAERAFGKQNLNNASVLNQKALKADPKYQPAQNLALAIERADKLKARLGGALAEAEKYAQLGYLYSPEGANAYDSYQLAILLDPGNEEAARGTADLIDKLSVQVWALVGEAKFDQAKAMLVRPLALMPTSERILAMKEAVDDVSAGR